jgi:hypothetical protein
MISLTIGEYIINETTQQFFIISPTIGEYIINEIAQQFFMISLTIGEYIINPNYWSYTQEHYSYCT